MAAVQFQQQGHFFFAHSNQPAASLSSIYFINFNLFTET
jgi:hypothetical protein